MDQLKSMEPVLCTTENLATHLDAPIGALITPSRNLKQTSFSAWLAAGQQLKPAKKNITPKCSRAKCNDKNCKKSETLTCPMKMKMNHHNKPGEGNTHSIHLPG